MKKVQENEAAIKAYIKRLENPYATLQVGDGSVDVDTAATGDAGIREFLRARKNPYAVLDYEGESNDGDAAVPNAAKAPISPRKSDSVSKTEFRTRCHQIFHGYTPSLEKGRLRPHHRQFISRNEARPPTERYQILRKLEKYDLSDIHGAKTHFNREDDVLTEEKLRQIEKTVDSEK